MAQITINEVSENYSYNIGSTTFCTVAMPITASWGPAFEDPTATGVSLDEMVEASAFTHFAANQAGLEAFIATYRGPAANYRSAKDYSYQMALTLLTSGYDLDVCRLSPGAHAQGEFKVADSETAKLVLKAKYPGTFGNSLVATLSKVQNHNYWNLITYVVDASGVRTAVENLVFVFNLDDSTDTILHIDEVESSFFTFVPVGLTSENITFTESSVELSGGTDRAADGTVEAMITNATALATARFAEIPGADATDYLQALATAGASADVATASRLRYMEWLYRYTMEALTILTDRLAYNCQRIILPGWDDQNIAELLGADTALIHSISPLHARLMEVAYASRCATAYVDIPQSVARADVWNQTGDPATEGYAQRIADYTPATATDGLFSTHAALFAPWGQYQYTGTGKQNSASPSFLALMIQRAMILNQTLQYEWAMPNGKKHNLSIGKLDYTVPQKLLDQWQSLSGVSLNVITDIPDLGVNVWGNSTLMNVPPARYNALQNLSSRLLMNAVKNVAFKCGLGITFQYNNEEAYSQFYAGVTPLLDTMKNVGAISGYKIEMAADINGLSQVNANSVIGKVILYVYGVINDITIDLVALPVSAAE